MRFLLCPQDMLGLDLKGGHYDRKLTSTAVIDIA